MQGAILIFGGNQEAREQKAELFLKDINLKLDKNNPDILLVEKAEDKKSIGIDQVREAILFLSEKPFSHKNKAILIKYAHLLTIQAQNALLKTLEETPIFALIILCSKTQDMLLETIVSRCRKVYIKSFLVTKLQDDLNIEKILKMDIGKRLDLAEQISKKEKEEIIEVLENWISELREEMKKSKNCVNFADDIKIVKNVKADLETTNVNARLALEFLMLNFV